MHIDEDQLRISAPTITDESSVIFILNVQDFQLAGC